ncbi:MAG: hypothetical protein GKR89_15485 [Candidatus Latescibacteria bacterium]|nr:hypothetical protein [Candidatus Latescibacterota bacterium]
MSLPKILLLGDSIRMSYQATVADLLDGRAQVVGPGENCQFSLYTLSALDRWIDELGTPDIVHWNNGIHDAGHNPARTPLQIPLDAYRAHIDLIAGRLLALTPRVIWATSTPVHPERPFREDTWGWRNEELDQYNAAALEVAQRHTLPVNHLHALVWDDIDTCLAEDQLHLSPQGIDRCARAVADAVGQYL